MGTAAAGGRFRPVGFEQPAVPERRVRTDEGIDLENLSAEEQSVVSAEQFIVFGKANIEQWNDPGPGEDHLYIEMDALEESLDQLLAIENISFGHQDVRVGEPLESHTLDTDATVHLSADETLHFDAGDELRTEVIREGEPLPDGSGPAEEDALWLAANVFGREDPRGSRFSQKVRLGAYYGDLDGFSVTVDKLEMTPTDEGTVTHAVDFLAVTIGDDELIKNPGSSFGVAEFQALFGSPPYDAAGAAEGTGPGPTDSTRTAMSSFLQSLRGSATDGLAAEVVQQAYDEGTDLESATDAVADGDDEVLKQAEEKEDTLESEAEALAAEADDEDYDADEIEDRAADLADELGIDKEVVMAAVDEVRNMQEEVEDPDEDPEEDPDDNGGGEGPPEQEGVTEERVTEIVESQLDERLPDGEVATQAAIEEALDGLATADELEEQLSDLGSSLGDSIGEFVEEQMKTGTTPGPTGGGVNVEDFESEAEQWADEITPDGGA